MNKKEITIYKATAPTRISRELYEIDKYRWKLSTTAYRLFFAIIQNIDEKENNTIFPEMYFEKNRLFQYLGLENNKDKYERTFLALQEIQRQGLYITEKTKKGNIKWKTYAWIVSSEMSSNESYVRIKVNEDVKPFLVQLKSYSIIQPKYYLKLNSEYQNWFYPLLKSYSFKGQLRISIEELKKGLFLEDCKSYNSETNKNATENFLKRVIGIQISKEAKDENKRAKTEKREPKIIAWDYIKDKEKKDTGTLYSITQNTDITVRACAIKKGRTYTDVIFLIVEKTNCMTETHKEKYSKYVKIRRKIKDEKDNQQSLFNDIEFISNPAREEEKINSCKKHYYDKSLILEHSKATNKSIEQVVKEIGLLEDENGYYKIV